MKTRKRISIGCIWPTILAGVSFPTFVILKLTGLIGWHWLWVISPLWAIPALLMLWLIVGAILVIGVNVISD